MSIGPLPRKTEGGWWFRDDDTGLWHFHRRTDAARYALCFFLYAGHAINQWAGGQTPECPPCVAKLRPGEGR